jgi:hypothetical protein
MAQNQVTKLWTTIVTAFLALCTTLGLITTTAVAAVPQTGTTSNSSTYTMTPATAHEPWALTRSLPPTMKQRIRAEAHGSSPASRSRILSGRDRRDREAAPTGPNPADAAPADLCLV